MGFEGRNKKYFMKMDSDSFMIAENLLAYLNDLEQKTHGKPVYFGHAVCRGTKTCYGAGSGYGFNKQGLKAVNEYFKQNPGIVNEKDYHMIHEDYMVGNAYYRA